MRKKIFVLILIILIANSGCSVSSKTNTNTDEAEKINKKIVLLLPGPINDDGWSANNYSGMRLASNYLNMETEYIENIAIEDYEKTIKEYGEKEYDLILLAGNQFEETVSELAPSFPKSIFCVINGKNDKGSNLSPVLPKEYEASYLASVIAGNITKTGKLGVIGDYPEESIEQSLDIFEKNSIQIVETKKLKGVSIRAYTNSWTDRQLGKLIASQLIEEGVDVLFVDSHDADLGVIEIAKEKGVKVIGFVNDRTKINSETVVASVVYDFEALYKWVLNAYLNEKLEVGNINTIGVSEGVFKIVCTENIPKSLKKILYTEVDRIKRREIDFNKLYE